MITERADDDIDEAAKEDLEDRTELLVIELALLLRALDAWILLLDEAEDDASATLETADELAALFDANDAVHIRTLRVSASVVTVPPNAKALPVNVTLAPTVIPALSMRVPLNALFAPSVVAAVGVQNTSQAVAPPANVT